MENSGALWLSMLFGAIGGGYFVYGRRQQAGIPLAAGVLLCVFPWFVPNPWLMLGIGLALMIAPFVIRV